MWGLTVQAIAALFTLFALIWPCTPWVAGPEALLAPTAFVVAVSVFVSTIVMATDHSSQLWFKTGEDTSVLYSEYVVAHAVTPILFGVLLWSTYDCTNKHARQPQRFGNTIIVMATATIPIEVWSSIYNPSLVYHTNISPAYLLITFTATALLSSIVAVCAFGARPLNLVF